MIWTTTPWTLPANQALNLNPEFTYALVATERGHLVLAQDLVEACLARFKLEGRIVATAKGAALELIRFRHPLYDRAAPVYLGSYVTLEQGTGIVHSSPAYGVEDFQSCRRYGMTDDEILNPVGADGRFAGSLPFFGGEKIWEANPQIVDEAARARRAALRREIHAQLHALLAPPHAGRSIARRRSGSPGWTTCPAGTAGSPSGRCARRRSPASKRRSSTPAWGKARLYGMIANRPDWTLSAAAAMGRADAVLHAQGNRRAASAHARVAGGGRAAGGEDGGIEAWQTLDVRDLSADDLADYVKIKDTLDVWFDSGSHAPDGDGRPGRRSATGSGSHRRRHAAFPRTSISKGRTSIAAGFIRRSSCRAC